MENVNKETVMPEAIILAGGMGTRLKTVVKDMPKPMAPIGDRPFLSYILDELLAGGIRRVVLSTGYKHEMVETFFGSRYKNIELVYSVEEAPLGTGGAIKKALNFIQSPEALVLNGDTMFKVDLGAMVQFHHEKEADMTLALKKMDDCSRYGIVETVHHRVIRFGEKMASKSGAINGGIYLLKKDLVLKKDLPGKFSFEKDFMEVFYPDIHMMGYESEAYFIDIGIPRDYARAGNELLLSS